MLPVLEVDELTGSDRTITVRHPHGNSRSQGYTGHVVMCATAARTASSPGGFGALASHAAPHSTSCATSRRFAKSVCHLRDYGMTSTRKESPGAGSGGLRSGSRYVFRHLTAKRYRAHTESGLAISVIVGEPIPALPDPAAGGRRNFVQLRVRAATNGALCPIKPTLLPGHVHLAQWRVAPREGAAVHSPAGSQGSPCG